MKQKDIISVGIDIGTTTTSMIVSRLKVTNMAASYMAPDIEITTKDILYRSKVYLTPLLDEETLDGEKIREIIELEYRRAGIKPEQVDTGAVIITGESALKKNSEIILHSLSTIAGEFVVATAGPDLESIIAGRGAGAEEFSKKHCAVTANLDIGGGTTNIAVFYCGDLISQTCINVGGRLIRYNDEKRVIYVSERFRELGVLRNILIQEGELLTEKDLKAAGELLADTILDSIHMDHYSLTEIATNNMSEMLQLELPVEYLSFSGGVADCYYNQENNLTRYYDLGVALAQALAEKVENESFRVIRPQETIRATVVGAGSYMTEVSGSTISYNENVFPMKNLPVFVMGKESEYEMYQGFNQNAQRELKWYLEQIQDQRVAICMKGKEKLSYVELCNLAESLLMLDEQLFSGQFPLILVCANDMAKALGQVLNQKMKRRKSIVCLDCIRVRSGDYIDIGKPVMDGMAIPIVVKTLIFS